MMKKKINEMQAVTLILIKLFALKGTVYDNDIIKAYSMEILSEGFLLEDISYACYILARDKNIRKITYADIWEIAKDRENSRPKKKPLEIQSEEQIKWNNSSEEERKNKLKEVLNENR